VRFVSNPTQRVLVDNKLWSQTTLDKVLNTQSRFDSVSAQLQGFLEQSAAEDRVIIEFVKTKTNAIGSLEPLRTRLAQTLSDGQMARLELRQVETELEQPRV